MNGDTMFILAAIFFSTLWLNDKFNEIEERLDKIETALSGIEHSLMRI